MEDFVIDKHAKIELTDYGDHITFHIRSDEFENNVFMLPFSDIKEVGKPRKKLELLETAKKVKGREKREAKRNIDRIEELKEEIEGE